MHKAWCGKSCADCQTPCRLDEMLYCSPDCECLGLNGEMDDPRCKNCDAYLAKEYDWPKKMKRKKLSQETIEKIYEMYKKGYTVREISEQLNISRQTIYYHVTKDTGKSINSFTIPTPVRLHLKPVDPKTVDVLRVHRTICGWSYAEISRSFDIPYHQVRYWCNNTYREQTKKRAKENSKKYPRKESAKRMYERKKRFCLKQRMNNLYGRKNLETARKIQVVE